MSSEIALYAILSGAAGVTALVSTEIHPGILPQSVAITQSAISFRQVSDAAVGKFGADSDLTRARLQIDCWANKYDKARAIAKAVAGKNSAVRRYSGTAGGVVVQNITVLNGGTDLYEPDTGAHHIAVDIQMDFEA